MTVAAVILWLCCIFELITADKVVYLFGRISPGLSLFLSILLRAVPRIGVRAGQIEISREGIGRGIRQGNLWQRARNLCALISILLTWTMEDFVESASSMKSRGSALKGRTAYSIYRFAEQGQKSGDRIFLVPDSSADGSSVRSDIDLL